MLEKIKKGNIMEDLFVIVIVLVVVLLFWIMDYLRVFVLNSWPISQ